MQYNLKLHMRYIAALALLALPAFAAAPPRAAAKTHKAAQAAVRRPSSVARPGAVPVRRSSASAAARKKTAPVKHAVTWRNRQLAPTPDRYHEIQQALASRGYLQPDQATGAWDQNSADALKRFQQEQNIDASGKINSLSLIALGLGPKHDALPTQIAAPAPEQNNR